jgi:aminoglycoside 3-N-acetyltransferase
MNEINLFQSHDGTWITNTQLLAALEAVGAHRCRILYMHTELGFGAANPVLSRADLLGLLFETISELGVPTLCVPTFTFSFCNGENYDVRRSRSQMGVLNEYVRKLDAAVRSVDPLMSSTLVGQDRDLVENLGHRSIGTNSTFDKLHHKEGVKFLFFGASLSKCFTYTHYVEERENVPYRYNRDFTGLITDGNATYPDTYTLFVRYRNVIPASDGKLEKYLTDHGLLRKVPCGDSFISSVDESSAYETIVAQLRENIDCYLATPYPREGLDREFRVQNMVAL